MHACVRVCQLARADQSKLMKPQEDKQVYVSQKILQIMRKRSLSLSNSPTHKYSNGQRLFFFLVRIVTWTVMLKEGFFSLYVSFLHEPTEN